MRNHQAESQRYVQKDRQGGGGWDASAESESFWTGSISTPQRTNGNFPWTAQKTRIKCLPLKFTDPLSALLGPRTPICHDREGTVVRESLVGR